MQAKVENGYALQALNAPHSNQGDYNIDCDEVDRSGPVGNVTMEKPLDTAHCVRGRGFNNVQASQVNIQKLHGICAHQRLQRIHQF